MNSTLSDVNVFFSEIAERLWTGHASVMVGAGFSKNAINIVNAGKTPPNWEQLGDALYEKINGRKPDHKVKYLSLLKLAEEFEALFGRPSLDYFVAKNISDSEYEPSKLHSELLDLPWTDVFTTNYDTLLERSCKDVFSRKYDIVDNQNNLVYSSKPRIIKLHGSLPSAKPLIITEEDYRIYPKKFAPFVNTVQQSLLENTLCLIGFSGDDPNFLQWLGWITDNLGRSNAPKIYLIGVLNLSESQKKLLAKKNIIPLDLSTLNEVNQDHGKGLKIFIDYLASQRKKRENLEWPLTFNFTRFDPETIKQDFQPLITEWYQCRVTYPNWVILPHEQREILWLDTSNLYSNTSVFKHLNDFEDLDYSYELNWRLEKCLIPIYNDMASHFKNILNKYNFFPDLIIERREIHINYDGRDNIDWEKYKKYWKHLSLSLLRFYREENLNNEWQNTYQTLNLIKAHFSADELSNFFYEQVLYSIANMRLKKAKQLLNKWPQNHISVLWDAKRATLLAEFGDEKEAISILESRLLEIRRKLNLSPIESDYILVSQEAYIMFLLKAVWQNTHRSIETNDEESSHNTIDYNERWNDLRQYNCDPWGEKKYFDTVLQQPYSSSNQSIKQAFEIGREIRTYILGGNSSDSFNAYSFLRYLEELAIPLSLSLVIFNKKTISGAVERIGKVSQSMAVFILNRSKEEEVIDTFFTRSQIEKLPSSTIDNYVITYLNFFTENSSEIDSIPLVKAFIKKIPLLLSRLCTKCSENLKLKIFEFYKTLCNKELAIPKSDVLLRNLINSSSKETLFKGAIALLDTPILENTSPLFHDFIEPFNYIRVGTVEIATTSLHDMLINELLEKATQRDIVRTKAITRLMFLYNSRQLDSLQSEKLFDIIWAQTDTTSGFPTFTRYKNFAFIDWPHPSNVNIIELYKLYINKNDFSVCIPAKVGHAFRFKVGQF